MLNQGGWLQHRMRPAGLTILRLSEFFGSRVSKHFRSLAGEPAALHRRNAIGSQLSRVLSNRHGS